METGAFSIIFSNTGRRQKALLWSNGLSVSYCMVCVYVPEDNPQA